MNDLIGIENIIKNRDCFNYLLYLIFYYNRKWEAVVRVLTMHRFQNTLLQFKKTNLKQLNPESFGFLKN